MTGEERRQLLAVAAYEDRYHKGLWAGRDGTTRAVLDRLTARDLLTRSTDT